MNKNANINYFNNNMKQLNLILSFSSILLHGIIYSLHIKTQGTAILKPDQQKINNQNQANLQIHGNAQTSHFEHQCCQQGKTEEHSVSNSLEGIWGQHGQVDDDGNITNFPFVENYENNSIPVYTLDQNNQISDPNKNINQNVVQNYTVEQIPPFISSSSALEPTPNFNQSASMISPYNPNEFSNFIMGVSYGDNITDSYIIDGSNLPINPDSLQQSASVTFATTSVQSQQSPSAASSVKRTVRVPVQGVTSTGQRVQGFTSVGFNCHNKNEEQKNPQKSQQGQKINKGFTTVSN